MRAFGNRADAAVIDEPFYGLYLARTGIDHPLREATLASRPSGEAAIVRTILGPAPGGAAIFYQKHMAHHMLPGVDLSWMAGCRSFFLIRSPERVLASYAARRETVTAQDIGFARQAELFDIEARRLGAAPPVVEAEDVLAEPRRVLQRLCGALAIPFAEAMLSWPPGRRSTDGAWAPAWYAAVEASTGFSPPAPEPPKLPERLRRLADEARPHYERLRLYKLACD